MQLASATAGRRFLAITIVALTVAVLAMLQGPSPATAAPADPVRLNQTDAALLDGVRMAGLWEIPAGELAADRGRSVRVRQVGRQIADEHIRLDKLAVDAASRLDVVLPSTPTAEQQAWLKELEGATGTRFDQLFVDRLRAAHGKIFTVIGAVRAATRNPVIRQLAEDANSFAMNHMNLLESTNLVRFDQLAPAALPPAQDTSGAALARANVVGPPPVAPAVIWAALIAMLSMAGLATARTFARRGRRSS
jgi:predicted outer membrane protein